MMTELSAGFLPLTDSAILIAAKECGFAEAEGIALNLVRETSWANVRDKLAVGQFDGAGGGVQCGEQHVFRHDVRSGKLIEQSGFPRISISCDRGTGGALLFSLLTAGAALFPDLGELTLALVDPCPSKPTVHLDLLLTHTAGSSSHALSTSASGSPTPTTALAVEVPPHSGQAWQRILHLR